METLSDEFASQRQLAIVERFEGFINYMYPIVLNIRRTHYVARDHLIAAMLELIATFLPETGRGLPIGNLTSQLFANVYGHVLDRYLTHTLRIKAWLRYMDDTVVFAHSREALAVLQQGLKWFSDAQLGLRFSKWSIGKITQGLDWLGYRIWPTHKLLRKQSVITAKRKIFKYRSRGDELSLGRFIASWKGHAQWADSYNLLNKLGVAT